MDQVKKVYGYLVKIKYDIININSKESDYIKHSEQELDLIYTMYGDVKQVL